jgi:hypothetical protein
MINLLLVIVAVLFHLFAATSTFESVVVFMLCVIYITVNKILAGVSCNHSNIHKVFEAVGNTYSEVRRK